MDSFDDGDDGGWNSEISFERKNVSINALKERLPVPATITSLVDNQEDYSYVIGNYSFTTVQTVGILRNIHEDSGNVTYILNDPENSRKEYVAMKFSCSENDHNQFIDETIRIGMRALLIGKLKGFNGSNKILIFAMNKISDSDYTIFKLEAKVTKLFYEKDIIDKMRTGKLKRAHGMLAPPWTQTNSSPQKRSIEEENKNSKRTKMSMIASTTAHTTYSGEKKMIYEFLRHQTRMEDSAAEGISFHMIHGKMKNLTVKRLQDILEDMINDGSIFSTINDHYMIMDTEK